LFAIADPPSRVGTLEQPACQQSIEDVPEIIAPIQSVATSYENVRSGISFSPLRDIIEWNMLGVPGRKSP
jgi:hypothetical protein